MKENRIIYFFDESFHDGSISLKNECLNFEKKDVNEFYYGCFIGCDHWEEITPAILALEEKYKVAAKFEEGAELKSKHLVKQNDIRNGIASMPSARLGFYNDLFDILDGHVNIMLCALNKYEVLLRNVVPPMEWFDRNGVNYSVFMYSFSKFLTYHTEYKIPQLFFSYKNEKVIRKEIANILENHLKSILTIKKKDSEIVMLNQLISVIRNKNFYLHTIKTVEWVYDDVCRAFLLHCEEIEQEIPQVIIDEERTTFGHFEKFFPGLQSQKSDESVEVRVCDWIVGFFSKLCIAYNNCYKNDKENELTENITLLDSAFFPQREYQLEAIKKIYRLFIEQQEGYYATVTFNYADSVACFYTFIRYGQYCLENGKTMDSEEFNKWLVVEHERMFKDME